MKLLIATIVLALAASGCTTTKPGNGTLAPRAYVIAEIQVTDPVGYKDYLAAISPIVEKFGGTYLARAGQTRSVEGPQPTGRVVIIEFPSFAAAQSFEEAPESIAAAKIRHRTATSRIFVVEGSSP
ncbi:DUF1330 domain-containing protein [Microcystis aeruginosa NIES-298]|jgi:uncharacterized protein (DUF1330 family)|uniref:Uncharacterized protein n=3 Tax=Microcystis aeruginosa TaxID=1126 RepID=A0A2H6BXW8_MICAE|nr:MULTISPECIES: DUF1330 domain-containing protein [Microcystis]TRU33797.1 MAG: DUF1330 domain-containing protein [Microcystis aeruginosa Ma_MB_F_20061100_S20]TRU40518.1 MAG: DUF1330 domain-containing protein [Microcystis aeruginosa Ma_MB_F_20061100_S20D]MDB9405854.1 DUF1330 domain-containing protein [Microcystis sp. CS-574]MDB9417952.1 DUF1330 domain-containing protein [Microcystis aeruginosa CS-556/03]QHU84061.1 DUF1330 domain-containing protein [Microcystis aeruginosa NIES-298]